MGQCCACSLVEGLGDGEVQVPESNPSPKHGDKKHKHKGKHASRTPSSSRDRESRSKTPLSPISESLTQEATDPQALEDVDEPMCYQLPKPDPAEKGSGAAADGGEETPTSLSGTTATTPTAGDSPSSGTATPTGDDWAVWTVADASAPASQVEDDWADWEQAPPAAAAASEPKQEEAPVAKPSTQAVATPEDAGAASHEEPAQVSWPMVPATRELSAAAPKRPGVFPRFASIEAWISGLPELEAVEPPKEEPIAAASSNVPPAAWNMRPSVGTWLAVRRTCCAPASAPGTCCRLAFGFALPGSPKAQGPGLTAEALARAAAGESPGGSCEKPSEFVTSEVQAADDALSSFSDAESILCMAMVPNAPIADEEPVLPSDPFAGCAAEAARAPALEEPAACEEPILSSDPFAACGAEAAEARDAAAVWTAEAATPALLVPVAAEQRPGEPRRSWRLLPSVGTWLAPRPFQEEAVPEARLSATLCARNATCLHVAAEGGSFLDEQSNEIFRAAASVLPKMKPPVPILPGEWKPSAAKASVLSFDPYAPEDEEPSTTDTEGGEKAEDCPIS